MSKFQIKVKTRANPYAINLNYIHTCNPLKNYIGQTTAPQSPFLSCQVYTCLHIKYLFVLMLRCTMRDGIHYRYDISIYCTMDIIL